MSLFRRSAAVQEFTAIAIVKPVSAVPRVAPVPRTYSDIAAEIGLQSPAMTKNAILAWLSEREVKVYDSFNVHEFLARQIGNNGEIHWQNLRKADYAGQWNGWRIFSGVSVYVWGGRAVYDLPVPLHAIRLVRDLEAAIGKESLSFYVSHALKQSEIPLNDPFLAVAARGTPADLIVIDMWDEPGWNERSEP